MLTEIFHEGRAAGETLHPIRRSSLSTRATVLFADMRGYTGLAEQLAPARVLPLLYEFFAILTSITLAHGGQVFHTAGDSMMAGFGINDPGHDGAREALCAGNAMLHRFAVLASRWREELSIATGIGVGLHLGEVALGYFGPTGEKTLTLVGDTPNVASLLCSHARPGEVLFSCTVAASLIADGGHLPATIGPISILKLPRSELRGRKGLLDFWCVPTTAECGSDQACPERILPQHQTSVPSTRVVAVGVEILTLPCSPSVTHANQQKSSTSRSSSSLHGTRSKPGCSANPAH